MLYSTYNLAFIYVERIEIKPTNAQEKMLSEISEKCRLIYNYALAERLTACWDTTDIVGGGDPHAIGL